jgi:hypothetical protein
LTPKNGDFLTPEKKRPLNLTREWPWPVMNAVQPRPQGEKGKINFSYGSLKCHGFQSCGLVKEFTGAREQEKTKV